MDSRLDEHTKAAVVGTSSWLLASARPCSRDACNDTAQAAHILRSNGCPWQLDTA
jgi:hypothetical protein